MPIQTLNTSASGAFAGSGDSNNAKANANFQLIDNQLQLLGNQFQLIGNQVVQTLTVTPGNVTVLRFACNGPKTITKIEGRKFGAWSTGDYTLQMANGTGNTLMSASPYDAKAGLSASAWTEIALSATPADLALADGTPIFCVFTSSSGGANANDALLLRFTFAD